MRIVKTAVLVLALLASHAHAAMDTHDGQDGVYKAGGHELLRLNVGSKSVSVTSISATSIYTSDTEPIRPILRQVFDTSGTWTKPTNYSSNAVVFVQCWGGGGGGGRSGSNNFAGGGGGGNYFEGWMPLSLLSSTETVTIGAGGVGRSGSNGNGTAGGTSTFGSYLAAAGGGAGLSNGQSIQTTSDGFGVEINMSGTWLGGVGNCCGATVLDTYYGGPGGGGGSNNSSNVGKRARLTGAVGGNGGSSAGANGSNGTGPGAGGGGCWNGCTAGNGANGRCVVTTFN